MIVLVLFLFFIIGSAVGSFLTVVIDRIPRGESIFLGRSHCENCQKLLGPLDLIPLLSFFLLHGRCRYCKAEIGWHYPFIEAVTGIAFVAVGLMIVTAGGSVTHLVDSLGYLYLLFLLSSFIVLFFVDLFYGIIPFFIMVLISLTTAGWYLLSMFYSFSYSPLSSSFVTGLIAGFCAFLFFFLLFLVTRKKGMGFGDVVYAAFMGFFLGFPGIVIGLYVAFLTGAVVSLILVVARKRAFKGGAIPFGPFLVTGTVVALFFSNVILKYVSIFILR